MLPDVYEGCSETKGCFSTPDEACIASKDCQILTSYRKLNDTTAELELYGKVSGNQYVALGLSLDTSMVT